MIIRWWKREDITLKYSWETSGSQYMTVECRSHKWWGQNWIRCSAVSGISSILLSLGVIHSCDPFQDNHLLRRAAWDAYLDHMITHLTQGLSQLKNSFWCQLDQDAICQQEMTLVLTAVFTVTTASCLGLATVDSWALRPGNLCCLFFTQNQSNESLC